MSPEMPTISTVTTTIAFPPQLLVGTQRILAVSWYCVLCLLSITLHTIFIVGARKLRGWDANFSFTLLLFISTMAILYFVVLVTASITALFYMDWVEYQSLWIFFGALSSAAYFTIVLLNLAIALHRLLYTAFPFTAGNYVNVFFAKVSIAAIGTAFLCILILFNTNLVGVRWIDSFMNFMAMQSRNLVVYDILNISSNYLVGVVNFVAYAAILLILVAKKKLCFTGNHELKMTLQVSFMMVGEMLFFIYWEFCPLQGFGDWDYVIAGTSTVLFFDILILPFIILNRNIHVELEHTWVLYFRKGDQQHQHFGVTTTAGGSDRPVFVKRPRKLGRFSLSLKKLTRSTFYEP